MKIDFKDMNGFDAARYCRKIMKEEGYPKTLEIYRGDMLCLTVDVEKASKLKLVENDIAGLHYRTYRPTRFSIGPDEVPLQSQSDLNDSGATMVAQEDKNAPVRL